DVTVAGERLRMHPAVVSARDYTVRGDGTVTFDQDVDATATLVVAPAFTADVISAVKEARFLTDDGGVISIPFRVTGRMANVRPRPDEAFVARALRKAVSAGAVGRLLDGKHKDALERGLEKFFGR